MVALRWIVVLYIGVVRHFFKAAALAAAVLLSILGIVYLLQDYLLIIVIMGGLVGLAHVGWRFRMRRW